MGNVFVETDPTKSIDGSLLNPHYSNPLFDKCEQTVFLVPGHPMTSTIRGSAMVDGISYEYSDRLHGYATPQESEEAWSVAHEKYPQVYSAVFIQEYLRLLFKDPTLELIHIVAGVNNANGYPYRVYGYRSTKK